MVGCMVSSSLSMAPAFVVAQGAEVVDKERRSVEKVAQNETATYMGII